MAEANDDFGEFGEGLSLRAAARRLGISASTAGKVLSAASIRYRQYPNFPARYSSIDVDALASDVRTGPRVIATGRS